MIDKRLVAGARPLAARVPGLGGRWGCTEELGPSACPWLGSRAFQGGVGPFGRLDRVFSGGWHGRQPAFGPGPRRRLVRGRPSPRGPQLGSPGRRPVELAAWPTIFGAYTSPIRRTIPARPTEPLVIDVFDEAIPCFSRGTRTEPEADDPEKRDEPAISHRRRRPSGVLHEPPGQRIDIRLSYRDGSGVFHADWPSRGSKKPSTTRRACSGSTSWGPMSTPRPSCRTGSATTFTFITLAVEDALERIAHPQGRRLGRLPLHRLSRSRIEPETDELDLQELDIFLGPNYLVTYHTAPLADPRTGSPEHRARPARPPAARRRPSPVSGFSSWRSTSRWRRSKIWTTRSMTIQNAVHRECDDQNARAIFRLKRSAIHLHKTLSPAARGVEPAGPRSIPAGPAQAPGLFSRSLRPCGANPRYLREPARSDRRARSRPISRSSSNRTNDIMKTLTIVTVMFMPMSFIVGFFGMNFFGETLAFTGPLPRGLALLGSRRDHGDIALFHLDLCAAQEVVLNAPQIGIGDGRGNHAEHSDTAAGESSPTTSGRISEPEPRRRISPLVAQLLINRGIEDPVRAGRLPGSQDGQLARPRTLPGAADGRRSDRPGHPRRPQDRDLRRLRRRRRLRHQHSLGMPSAGRCHRASNTTFLIASKKVTDSMPTRCGGLRRRRRRRLIVTVDCGISAVERGRAGERAWRRADHHRPPHDRRCAAARPPRSCIRACRAARIPTATSAARRVAFKLAWQVCKSFGDGKRASPHLRDFLVELARTGRAGDDRRRRAALATRTASWCVTAWPGSSSAPERGLRALMEVERCAWQDDG